MNEVILTLEGVEELIDLVNEYCIEHPKARLKEIARRFHNIPTFLDRVDGDDYEAVLNDLIHEINDSGKTFEFVQFMKKKTDGGKRYDDLITKYSSKKKESKSMISDEHETITKSEKQEIKNDVDENDLSIGLEACKDLVIIEKNANKSRKRAIIFGCIALSIIVITSLLFPPGKTIRDIPQISVPVILIILFCMAMALKSQIKSEMTRLKISGFKRYSLKAYHAYLLLKKYLESEPDFSHINNAKSELESISTSLDLYWGPEKTFIPSFRSLQQPIRDFITYMDSNFIPAFLDVYRDEVVDQTKILERQKTIVSLIKVFQSEDFYQISVINKILKAYIPLEIPKKKSKLQKIQENRKLSKILSCIIGSVVIVLGSLGLSYLLTLHPETTYQDFVNWFLLIAIPLMIGYNVLIIKR